MTIRSANAQSTGDAGRLTWPAELIALGFHLLMIWSVVAAMHRVDSGDRFAVLGPLATAGLLFGFFLARTSLQDLFAHSIAVWAGALASFLLVSIRVGEPSEIIETRARVLRDLVSGVGSSLARIDNGPVADEQLLVVLGITSWLLAYSSAWVVYRRRWFTAGIGVPAVILVSSLRVDNLNGGWELFMFIVGAVGLAARDTFASFLQRWVRRGLSAPKGAATWFMVSAVPIAVVTALLTSAMFPLIERTDRINVSEEFDDLTNTIQTNLGDLIGMKSNIPSGYTDFAEEWDTDGSLDLSDAEVAVVTSSLPNYLAARRYDDYTGRGWRTNVDATFANSENPDQPVTNVTYTASNSVNLTTEVSGGTTVESAIIALPAPSGDLVLTIGVFFSANRSVQTVMGWIQIEPTMFDVENDPIENLPIDLQALIADMRGASFSQDSESAKIVFDDPGVNGDIQSEIDRLAQFPVNVTLGVGAEGQLIVTYSGRVPNYDDIETVYFQDDIKANDSYETAGVLSQASAENLAAAGQTYPQWVIDRYLTVSDTVTDRTRAKAAEIATQTGSDNPYEIARAIETWLHSSEFEYQENPPELPDGDDLVDSFLFDLKVGRCQQYASAMAVLLRSAGIPSRVVLGYNSNSEQNENGDWVYRARQGHAWVEVFFPGYGWIPFEPTPGFSGFETNPEPTSELAPDASPTAIASPAPDTTVETVPTPTSEPSPVPPVVVAADDDQGGFGALIAILFGIGLTLIAAITTYMLISWNRGLGGLRPASGYFARLIKLGAWFGLEPGASTTPGEFAHSFARTVPGTEAAVRSITEAYYLEQFNPASMDKHALERAESGWKQLRRNLLRWRIRTPK